MYKYKTNMVLSEKLLNNVKYVVTHEMGHFISGFNLKKKRLSKEQIRGRERVFPTTIRVNIFIENEKISVSGCISHMLSKEERIPSLLGGPAIELKTGVRYSHYVPRDKNLKAVLGDDRNDFTRLLYYFKDIRRVQQEIELQSKMFTSKDINLIDKFLKDQVIPKVEQLPENIGNHRLEFALSDLIEKDFL